MSNDSFVPVDENKIKDDFDMDLSVFFNRRVDNKPLYEISEEYSKEREKAYSIQKELMKRLSGENKDLLKELVDQEHYTTAVAENVTYQQGFKDAFRLFQKMFS